MASETEHKSAGGTVDLAGHKVKKSTALIFGAAAVGVVAVAVIRKRSAAASAASAAGSSTAGQFTDPAGNTCSAPDPSTGFCPGTPEDISAQEQLSAGSADYGDASSYTPPSLTGNNTGLGSSVPVFTDNGSWAQYVEQALGSDGTDAIAAAIAKYLNGQSITEAQQTTVEQAIAIANYPPVAGPGGFPPSINLQASTPVPTPAPAPSPNPGGVTVPPTTGGKPAAPTGLKASVTTSEAVVTWNAVKGATSYNATREGVGADAGITGTTHTFSGLKPGTRYTYKIVAKNAKGYSPPATSSFTTLPNAKK